MKNHASWWQALSLCAGLAVALTFVNACAGPAASTAATPASAPVPAATTSTTPAPAPATATATASAPTSEQKKDAWAQVGSDLKPDPKAVFGTLANGFRYVILPNKEPPTRMSMRLYVHAGSVMETDAQQGLAHFLEHMAFNGSEHFAPGQLVEYLQRLGMGFGPDLNAQTSYFETVYKLDLPETSGKVLTDSLQLMRDYAGGLSILSTEIDRERGVILSEKRDRDNVAYRTFVANWAFYFPDGVVSKRHPIGQEDTIKGANHDLIASFYQDWYTPDRMVLVIVGDVQPADLEALIKTDFDSLPAKPDKPLPDLGKYGSPGFAAEFHRDAEAPDTEINLDTIAPFDRGPDSQARRDMELRLDAAEFIVTRRLDRIIRQPDSPISAGEAYDYTFLNTFEDSGISVVCQPKQWQAALDVAEQELRRALQYGFTPAEVAEAKANLLNNYEEAVKTAPTRKSRALSEEVAESLGDQRVYTSPEQDLALAQPVLDTLTPANCLQTFQDAWGKSGRRLFVSGNLALPDSNTVLVDAYNKSTAVAVSKPTTEGAQVFGYASIGKPGEIIERTDVADLGITQLRFANNVRVNLKPTDFEQNKIHVLVQFGGGRLDVKKTQPALGFMASQVFIEGGLGKHSADELQRLLAGKTVGDSFAVADNFFNLGGDTNAQDLRLQLELLKAFVTDPGFRPEALALAKRQLPELYNQLRTDVELVAGEDQVPRFLASGDYRFGVPSELLTSVVTLDDIRQWLTPILHDSYMEISIVGDFKVDDVLPLLAATFGTLPERAAQRPDYASVRNVKFPASAEGSEKTFLVPTVIPKAIAGVYWPTCDRSDIDRVRELGVLGEIFSDRLRLQLRQQLAQTYSPDAGNDSSETFPGYGFTVAECVADPKQAEGLLNKMRDIGAQLAAGGITADEFNRAVTPLRAQIPELRRQNGYWLGTVLAGSQAFPQYLARARTLPTAYDKVTTDQVAALAKQYLQPDNAVRILVTPDPATPAPPAVATPVPAATAPAAK